jgi:hypothetical protein
MAVQEKMGLRHGHPTAWKFRQWTRPDDRDGLRRLAWANGFGEFKRGPKETDLVIPELFGAQPFVLNNLTNEGEQDFADVYFDDQAVRSNLYVRGYNDTPVETDSLSDLTGEVTGTGYAALDYVRGTDWTAAAGAATGVTKTWTAGGAWTAMTHVVVATVASGTSGLTISYVALSATRTLANGETLDVTPTVTIT